MKRTQSGKSKLTGYGDRRQPATVYDAVAGRIGYEGFLTEERPSRHRDRASTTSVAVPPDEVLFRRNRAPIRHAEDDFYEADRHLNEKQRLPDSDLLKVIHAYVADFYERTSGHGMNVDTASMDETALLAMGVLIEEVAKEGLGRTGHLALLEPTETDGK
jgi:hypothetical protein